MRMAVLIESMQTKEGDINILKVRGDLNLEVSDKVVYDMFM